MSSSSVTKIMQASPASLLKDSIKRETSLARKEEFQKQNSTKRNLSVVNNGNANIGLYLSSKQIVTSTSKDAVNKSKRGGRQITPFQQQKQLHLFARTKSTS